MAVTSTLLKGAEEGTEETADAAGVVGVGAVADSIVVLGGDGGTAEAGAAVACLKILTIRSVNIPIKITYARWQRLASAASRK